uniref:Uncharacterized protein n=1 Tax=Trichogramma kaykai TaxID=54128 RepID=A0ABD2XAJ4_9HYME
MDCNYPSSFIRNRRVLENLHEFRDLNSHRGAARRANRSKSSGNRTLLRSRSPKPKATFVVSTTQLNSTERKHEQFQSTATAAAVAAVTLASMSKRKRMPQIAGGQRANEREHRPMACRGQTLGYIAIYSLLRARRRRRYWLCVQLFYLNLYR